MKWGPDPNAAKTFIVQFIYQNGNGWAFINAPSVTKATEVFKAQTIYAGAKVTNVKETKYYGTNMQLVFEGSVTTIDKSIDIVSILEKQGWIHQVEQIIDEAVRKADVEHNYGGRITNLNNQVTNLTDNVEFNYYNKDYINSKIEELTRLIIDNAVVVDDELDEESENPVTNAAITQKFNEVIEMIPPKLSHFYNDIDQTLIIRAN